MSAQLLSSAGSRTPPQPSRRYSPALWHGEPVRFSWLARSGGTPGCTTADRLDPFWGGMWACGSSALWVSRQLAETRAASGLARIPARLDMPAQQAADLVASGKHFGPAMAALGALDQWRTLSAEQMAALTGWPVLGRRDPAVLVALFRLGVIDRGTFAAGLLPGASSDRATLYRPSRSDAFDERIAPLLSLEQKVAVSGGMPWDYRRQFDRHNLLSAELGLRVSEFCEVGTVLGEKLSDVSLMLGGAPSGGGHSADLTIVRADGLRIAVELTASAGPDFRAKVRRWAQLLESRSLASSGLMVLFVEAAPFDGATRWGRSGSTRSSVYKAVREVVREFPGSGADRVAERVGVVSWAQWFPGPGMATREFTVLEVDRPTGSANDLWQRTGLLDVVDVPFAAHDPAAMTAVIDNASLLLGTPHWLRRGRRPWLWSKLVQDAGWGSDLPVPPPARAERFVGREPGGWRGQMSEARLPARMRADLADPPASIVRAGSELATMGRPAPSGW